MEKDKLENKKTLLGTRQFSEGNGQSKLFTEVFTKYHFYIISHGY